MDLFASGRLMHRLVSGGGQSTFECRFRRKNAVVSYAQATEKLSRRGRPEACCRKQDIHLYMLAQNVAVVKLSTRRSTRHNDCNRNGGQLPGSISTPEQL